MPRRKASSQPKEAEEDIVVELVCEWGVESCQQRFPLNQFIEFRAHIESHIRQILPGYANRHSKDPIPEDFTCPWQECGWDSPEETDELIRHILFHAFHTKLKALGTLRSAKAKHPKCNLETQGRNLVPDMPDPFLCEWEDCALEFNCPNWFYRHVESHAMAVDKVETKEKGVRKTFVTCLWAGCSTKVKNHYKLKEHCHTHTREKMYACSVCGGMFASTSKFTDHLSRQNTSEFETFQCSHCLKYCGSQRILRDHMRHHVNNIKCEFCDMTCPNPSALKQHIKFRHSSDRPYECDVCDYSCKTFSDLRRHRESHNAVFTYNCAVEGCDFTARAMQTLKRHFMIKHEGAELAKYECHLCGSRYTRGTGLTSHLKVKHKFRWPAGHPRFRYKEHEDGIWRLQTVRFESLQLSQQLNEKETLGEEQMTDSPDGYQYSDPDSPQTPDDMSSERGGDNDGEVDIEGSSDSLEDNEETSSQQGHNNGSATKDRFQYLLMQYEQHEHQVCKKQTAYHGQSSEIQHEIGANQTAYHEQNGQSSNTQHEIGANQTGYQCQNGQSSETQHQICTNKPAYHGQNGQSSLQGPVRIDRRSVRSHPYGERPASPDTSIDVPRTLLALQEAAMRLASRQDS